MYDLTQMLNKEDLLNNLEFPRLVSYPRTGSHWFRVLMERYTNQPAYVRSFFDPNPKKMWGFHIHNREIEKYEESEGATRNLKKVIYLYRDPCETIFSLLKYDKIIPPRWEGDINDELSDQVEYLTLEYKKHLQRWTVDNNDIHEIILIRYSDLKQKPQDTFKKVISFLGFDWDENKFNKIFELTDKESVKKVTPHDNSVIHDEEVSYKDVTKTQRRVFKKHYEEKIKLIIGDLNEKF